MRTYGAPAWMDTAALPPRWGHWRGSHVSSGKSEGLPSGVSVGSLRPCEVASWVREGAVCTAACSLDVSLGRAVDIFEMAE